MGLEEVICVAVCVCVCLFASSACAGGLGLVEAVFPRGLPARLFRLPEGMAETTRWPGAFVRTPESQKLVEDCARFLRAAANLYWSVWASEASRYEPHGRGGS